MAAESTDLDRATLRARAASVEPLDRRIVLAGLWTSMLFVFAYVDLFGFFRADVIEGVLGGVLSGPGFDIDQTFLVMTTLYILIPSLMVAGSLVLPYRINRIVNLALAVLYLVTILVSMVGEAWLYYLVGSVVEVGLLAAIATVAMRWR